MMTTHRIRIIAGALALLVIVTGRSIRAQSAEADRITEAMKVLGEIMDAPDTAIPSAVLAKTEAIAVFPGTLKGGFVVGAQRGRGIISSFDRKSGTWSSPAFLTLTGGTFGAQIGGQSIDLVLVIKDGRGVQNLVRNEFKIGADASVAAGPVGRDIAAATDVQLRAQILSYSRSRGLFAGVTINGSAIRADTNANRAFYGRPYNTRDIVFERLGGAPEPVKAWRDALSRYISTR